MAHDNVEIVRSSYEIIARQDISRLLEIWDPQIEWREAEGHPYSDGNPYIGPDRILDGVFSRLGGEWEDFTAHPEEFLAQGDTVVVIGRYTGTYKSTGRPLDAQVVHVYRLRDGKVISFQQFSDTAQFARVMSPDL